MHIGLVRTEFGRGVGQRASRCRTLLQPLGRDLRPRRAVGGYVDAATEDFPEEWDLDALWTALRTMYPVTLRHQDLEAEAGGRDAMDRDELREALQADAQAAYAAREADLGAEVMRELERRVLLSVLDRKWREHLYEMDYLREGIGLRAYSQRDPLVEYQREGFDMFGAMKDGIREETVGFLFNVDVQLEDEEPDEPVSISAGDAAAASGTGLLDAMNGAVGSGSNGSRSGHPAVSAKGLDAPQTPANLTYSAPDEDGEVEVHGSPVATVADEFAGVSRNELCPCGSGKKFKRCHGGPGGPSGQVTRAGG